MSEMLVALKFLFGAAAIALIASGSAVWRRRGFSRAATTIGAGIAALVVGLGLESAHRFARTPDRDTAHAQPDSPSPLHSPLMPGAQCPEIEADGWLNGTGPDNSQLAGRVVVLDLWSAQ